MRIGIDGRLLDKKNNTGISRYTEFMLDYYMSRYKKECIYIITNDVNLKYLGCNIVYTSLKPFNLLHFCKYARFVSQLKLDLLHVPFYSGTNMKLKETKVVVTVHDLMYRLVDDFFGINPFLNYAKRCYFDFIVKRTLINADVVISVSQTTQMDLFNIFHVSSKHIPEFSIVHSKPDDSILERYGLERKKYFFYCGNNRLHKNLQFVIDLFNSHSDFPHLVLAGKGHADSKNVINLGVVTENELKSLYTSSIAFIFPSKYEGFGLPILEALDCKSLVIASEIPAFTEFKSKNILFFKIGDQFSFVSAIKNAMKANFVEEPKFFVYYNINKIYSLLDMCCAK